MNRHCIIVLTIMLVSSSCTKGVEQIIVDIPDNNFLIALIEQGVDSNGDSIISFAEAEEITYLDVSGTSFHTPGEIENMQGIDAFINLDTLNCSHNQLASLDISNNAALVYLDCGNNQLAELDVSNNNILGFLSCYGNNLTVLNVSSNSSLEYLYCSSNQLALLDLSNNTALESLFCEGNPFITLNVSNNKSLKYLRCYNSNLTTLDVSGCTALEYLLCHSNTGMHNPNQLTSLDITNNTVLEVLLCGGNLLTELNIVNNTGLNLLGIYEMPSLSEVCVWEMPFPPANVSVDTTDSPNVYFTADCN